MNAKASARYWVLIVAGGAGRRMQSDKPKQYIEIAGQPVLCHTLDTWLSCPGVAGVVLGVQSDDRRWAALRPRYPQLLAESPGGASRMETVLNGLQTLAGHAAADDRVLVHDAVRPCIEHRDIATLMERAGGRADGGLLACPLSDSVKRADPDSGPGPIAHNVERCGLWRALTPQLFRLQRLRQALRAAARAQLQPEDEAAAIAHAGGRPLLVEGSPANIKITTPHDLQLAELYLRGRAYQREGAGTAPRIGHGYDVHRLVAGRVLRLGGVEIPFDRGLQGHSDADVLLHAIMDACLGAAALGDIGAHFPDSDPAWRDADSGELLRRVRALIAGAGYGVANVDATVVAEAPRLAGHVAAMRANVAACLGITAARINIKATTTEGLGSIGQGAAIAAHAVVLLRTLITRERETGGG